MLAAARADLCAETHELVEQERARRGIVRTACHVALRRPGRPRGRPVPGPLLLEVAHGRVLLSQATASATGEAVAMA